MFETASYFNKATNFHIVQAFAYASGNTAKLDGPDFGTNTFAATPTSASLSGAGYRVSIMSGFQNVIATSHSASDVANLYGSPNGSALWAWSTKVTMFGSGFSNSASGFQHVLAYSANASDIATLYGSNSSPNYFFGNYPKMAQSTLI